MSLYQLHETVPHARIRAREATEFRLLLVVTFPLFLAAGALARLLTIGRAHAPRKSMVAEAKAAANTCIPYAFMR